MVVAAYEYVPDSEECRSEVSSTLEATQQTLSEEIPEVENQVELVSEDLVLMADVEWCLGADLITPQQCELVPQFSADWLMEQATSEVSKSLETPAAKHSPASWTFTQLYRQDEGRLAELVSTERAPSPQRTHEVEVSNELICDRSVGVLVPCHSRPATDYQSEGEEDDLFQDVAEPAVLTQPTDACQLHR